MYNKTLSYSPRDDLLFKAAIAFYTKDKTFPYIEVDLAVRFYWIYIFFHIISYCSFVRKCETKCLVTNKPFIKFLNDKLCRQG